ncbi:phage baseplate assembly protein V [Craterilacuibacter sp. RT1T]|uniref:phage baseplate assembly protein V n=1 Tax=Craterilacuibacter sp. RT1T TaxID=2942211 RepID=UPI0020BE3FE9|nr:phage baseplate assembly protein V [Craterilacuibacter sp. RT1T]MCL6262178.1 phage baseplate assembly protein V [Craterilacuibacter sp. RT1T]
MDITEIIRRIENLIRLGAIAEVDAGAARVRVTSGGIETDWLPWIHARAGTTTDWDPPSVGEQVIIFSPSGDTAVGIVMTGLNTHAAPAPSASLGECVRTYPDGARIAYRHETGSLSASGIKTATVQASEKCTVDCPASEFTGDVQVMGALTANGLFTYKSGMNGKGGSARAGGTVISGPIRHEGEFTNSGGLSSNGVSLPSHTHPGDSGGTTGTPK